MNLPPPPKIFEVNPAASASSSDSPSTATTTDSPAAHPTPRRRRRHHLEQRRFYASIGAALHAARFEAVRQRFRTETLEAFHPDAFVDCVIRVHPGVYEDDLIFTNALPPNLRLRIEAVVAAGGAGAERVATGSDGATSEDAAGIEESAIAGETGRVDEEVEDGGGEGGVEIIYNEASQKIRGASSLVLVG